MGSKEMTRMGTPIGLLNFGSRGSYFRLVYNELFAVNLEYTTGNCLNCSYVMGSEMPFNDNNQIYNQNALIAGYNPFQKTWGFGYGFQKVLYNKATIMPSPFNKKRVITYGLKFMHLNRTMALDKTFNLVSRINVEYGKRYRGMYFFGGVAANYFLTETSPDSIQDFGLSVANVQTGKTFGYNASFFPGYSAGVQFNL
jgi:hypothetical protein